MNWVTNPCYKPSPKCIECDKPPSYHPSLWPPAEGLSPATGGHLLKLHCPVSVRCNQNFVQLQKHSSAKLSEAIVCNTHTLED